ncbi:amino acid ABC transporter permease [Leuconostoc carnosum]|uniref:L-cystine permease n=2 Tax=Leuconostoc carnosum TaxID=1252 RepID=K0DFH5_LEUCJ|nr:MULTISPECIES: amino acid ABC transporter permease [Leuconostoc]AFT82447.1 L-cystine permease [Leuconostoc carnosum JB16]KAA8324556.1 amino acid ABC transporter permease [Leuconostoc carnosum]KAA8327122.1 amino acid ABC transporter permease [Leuconostoc carnosum]KAA8358229.1 amino acid ABC transporter permease [Leuconostoc carnosum]KAA8364727.1 amino acid ABC transporter permease [Leuconostoc carnosum]
MNFDIGFIFQVMGQIIRYVPVTIYMAVVSLIIGGALGLVVALVRYYKIPGLSQLLSIMITILKGVPLILIFLIIFLITSQNFNRFAKAVGWHIRYGDLPMSVLAIIGLSLMATVGLSEAFRGAFESVKQVQFDAARSLGMTKMQTIRRVLIPQTMPVALPMIINMLINLIKGTAIASLVSVVELFSAATQTASSNYKYFEAYIAAALIYWMMTIVIERGAVFLELRMDKKIKRS